MSSGGRAGDWRRLLWTFGVKKRNAEGQTVVDFVTMIEMAVVNRYFKKRGEHAVTFKSRGRRCYL